MAERVAPPGTPGPSLPPSPAESGDDAERAAAERVLSEALADEDVVAELLAMLQRRLHGGDGGGDLEADRRVLDEALADPAVVETMLQMMAPPPIPESEIEAHGWPTNAFARCTCSSPLSCMRWLARDTPEKLDARAARLRRLDERAAPEPTAADRCTSTFLSEGMRGSSEGLTRVVAEQGGASGSAQAQLAAASAAADKERLSLYAELVDDGCCSSGALGFVGRSERWLRRSSKRTPARLPAESPHDRLKPATDALATPCCQSGCLESMRPSDLDALRALDRDPCTRAGARMSLLYDEHNGQLRRVCRAKAPPEPWSQRVRPRSCHPATARG